MKPSLGGRLRRRFHAAPRRRPTGPADRPYRRPGGAQGTRKTKPVSSESLFSPMTVLLLIVAIGLCVAMGLILKPKNLGKINGYPAELITTETRNLLADVQKALDPKQAAQPLTFTEEQVNQYLNQRVKGKQGGPLSALVKFQGVYVDFEPNQVDVYLVRSVAGLPFSISSSFTRKPLQYTTIWKAAGGSIGSFNLRTKQFKPIVETFQRLHDLCKDEMDCLNSMASVEVGDDQIVLTR